MDIRAHDGALYEWEGDVLALGVFEENLLRNENNTFVHPGLAELDYDMGGVLGELVSASYYSLLHLIPHVFNGIIGNSFSMLIGLAMLDSSL